MPVKNRFAELLPEITAWRRDLHRKPRNFVDTHRTRLLLKSWVSLAVRLLRASDAPALWLLSKL
jgi:hypothetical protein